MLFSIIYPTPYARRSTTHRVKFWLRPPIGPGWEIDRMDQAIRDQLLDALCNIIPLNNRQGRDTLPPLRKGSIFRVNGRWNRRISRQMLSKRRKICPFAAALPALMSSNMSQQTSQIAHFTREKPQNTAQMSTFPQRSIG